MLISAPTPSPFEKNINSSGVFFPFCKNTALEHLPASIKVSEAYGLRQIAWIFYS